jgi:uncharacterized membrane protein YdjX (TVP38/TMEM64 family)
LIGGALAAWFLWLDERLPAMVEWVQARGAAGALAFGAAGALATVLMIPGALITLLAGYVYGPWLGTLVVSPASVAGATAAFLLGRTLFRARFERRIAGAPRFQALQAAIARQGLRILVLVRLSPIFPYSLVNYLFGLTRLRVGSYVAGSWLGMLPGTFLYVYLGSTVEDLTQLAAGGLPDAGGWGLALKIAGLVATLLVTVLVTRAARRAPGAGAPALADREGAGGPDGAGGPGGPVGERA